MRLRLIIVDDEPIILNGLSKTYPWDKMGYELVGAYPSGEIALEELPVVRPDVILTDVRMKKISGIELMEKAKEIAPEITFVVISAYRDFDYAKKACEYGAFTYLLKPVEEQELQSTMKAVYETVQEQRKNLWEKKNLENVLRNNADSYLAVIVERYLKGIITREEIQNVFQTVGGTLCENERYLVVIVDLDITYRVMDEVDYETKRFALFEHLRQQFTMEYIVWNFRMQSGVMVYILQIKNRPGTMLIKRMLEKARADFPMKIVSVISNEMYGCEGIRNAYEQASQMFGVAREAGAGLLVAEKNEKDISTKNVYSENSEHHVLNSIRKNDLSQFKENYIRFIYSLPNTEDSDYVFQCIHRLALNIEFLLYDSYGRTSMIRNSFQNFYKSFQEVNETKAIDILYQLIIQVIEERTKCSVLETKQYFKEYIKQSLNYIEDHLEDESLSITSVAAAIYLNPVYFGRVFKSSMGISFKQYVINRRMELAKKLIKEGNHNVTTVGLKVGINNPSYFSQLFKQYTGYLPSEY